jgi:hypothetical protein
VGKEKKASNGGTPGDVNGNSLEVKGGYQVDRTNTVKNEVVKLSSSQGTVNVAGDSVTLQGTRIDAATGANVVATKGTVTNQAVVDINQKQGGGFNVAIGLEQAPKDAKPGTGGKDPAAAGNAPSNANTGGVTGNRARADANAAQNAVLQTPSGGRARANANAAQNPVIPSPNPGLGQTDGGTPPTKPKLETEGSGSGGFNVYNQTDKDGRHPHHLAIGSGVCRQRRFADRAAGDHRPRCSASGNRSRRRCGRGDHTKPGRQSRPKLRRRAALARQPPVEPRFDKGRLLRARKRPWVGLPGFRECPPVPSRLRP